jgi:hypothetical protein
MLRNRRSLVLATAVVLAVAGLLTMQIPAARSRIEWRLEVWSTYLKNSINPVGPMPTHCPQLLFPRPRPISSPTALVLC